MSGEEIDLEFASNSEESTDEDYGAGEDENFIVNEDGGFDNQANSGPGGPLKVRYKTTNTTTFGQTVGQTFGNPPIDSAFASTPSQSDPSSRKAARKYDFEQMINRIERIIPPNQRESGEKEKIQNFKKKLDDIGGADTYLYHANAFGGLVELFHELNPWLKGEENPCLCKNDLEKLKDALSTARNEGPNAAKRRRAEKNKATGRKGAEKNKVTGRKGALEVTDNGFLFKNKDEIKIKSLSDAKGLLNTNQNLVSKQLTLDATELQLQEHEKNEFFDIMSRVLKRFEPDHVNLEGIKLPKGFLKFISLTYHNRDGNFTKNTLYYMF